MQKKQIQPVKADMTSPPANRMQETPLGDGFRIKSGTSVLSKLIKRPSLHLNKFHQQNWLAKRKKSAGAAPIQKWAWEFLKHSNIREFRADLEVNNRSVRTSYFIPSLAAIRKYAWFAAEGNAHRNFLEAAHQTKSLFDQQWPAISSPHQQQQSAIQPSSPLSNPTWPLLSFVLLFVCKQELWQELLGLCSVPCG